MRLNIFNTQVKSIPLISLLLPEPKKFNYSYVYLQLRKIHNLKYLNHLFPLRARDYGHGTIPKGFPAEYLAIRFSLEHLKVYYLTTRMGSLHILKIEIKKNI